MQLTFLLTVLAPAICAISIPAAAATTPQLIQTDRSMGIQAYSFLVDAEQLKKDTAYELRVYMLTTCQKGGKQVHLRGFAGAFPIEGSEDSGRSVSTLHFQPPALQQHKLQVLSTSTNSTTDLQWFGPSNQGLWRFDKKLTPTGREVLMLQGSLYTHQLVLSCAGPVSAQTSAESSAQNPAHSSAQQPVLQYAGSLGPLTANSSAETSAETSAHDPAARPAERSAHTPAESPAETSAGNPAQTPALDSSPRPGHSLAQQPVLPSEGAWNVVTTTSANQLTPETLAHLLSLHLQYHQRLGFDGTILRCNKGEAQALVLLPHIEALVASRQLIIWPWVSAIKYCLCCTACAVLPVL
jgi:hypothetical protein